MRLDAIDQELAAFEGDATLEDESNLDARVRALDFIRFLQEVARTRQGDDRIADMQRRAEMLHERLARVNDRLFKRVRQRIRSGDWTRDELRRELDRFTRYPPRQPKFVHIGFDGLDALIDGILQDRPQPAPTLEHVSEMIDYQPSPASVVLDLLDQVEPSRDDIFYDLGSGLGRVVILVSLLAGIASRGIEYQPTFCSYSREVAAALGLTEVAFVNSDARSADLSEGTIFYLFTPFTGSMLQTVLGRLYQESQRRQITICTYGPCTRDAFAQPWLRPLDPTSNHDFRLAIFRSV